MSAQEDWVSDGRKRLWETLCWRKNAKDKAAKRFSEQERHTQRYREGVMSDEPNRVLRST